MGASRVGRVEDGWGVGAIVPAKVMRVGWVSDPIGSQVDEGGGWAPTLLVDAKDPERRKEAHYRD